MAWDRGRTVFKTTKCDLDVVICSLFSEVIIQLGRNDLATILAMATNLAIGDLTGFLFEHYGVELICVCQTLSRNDAPSFNTKEK